MENKKTRILISKKELHYFQTGVARRVLHEIDLLSQKGFDVHLISEKLDTEKIQKTGGKTIKVMRWPISGYFRRALYNRLVQRHLRFLHYDLTIGHGEIVDQDVLFLHNCVHLASELIKGEPLPKEHEVGRIHEKIFQNRSYLKLICNSNLMKNDLVNRFALDAKKVDVIYPETDLTKFFFRKYKGVLKNHNIDDNTFTVGVISSGNFPKRNVDLIIEVAKSLKDHTDLVFLIIGNHKRLSLPDEVKSLKNIKFLPPTEDIVAYYQALDLFFLPARIEEFGRVVAEAMATGNPVLVSNKVGASEILEGEQRNYIFEPNDLLSFKKSILEIKKDNSLKQRLIDINLNTIKKYSCEEQDRKFLEVISEVLNLKKSKSSAR